MSGIPIALRMSEITGMWIFVSSSVTAAIATSVRMSRMTSITT